MPIIQLPSVNLSSDLYLWAWHCTESEAELLSILQWSDHIIKEKQSLYTHPKAWIEHLFSRCLLQESQKSLQELVFFGEREFGFSLSHSHEYSVVAYGSGKIGIDLEAIHPKVINIAPKFMNAIELAHLAQLPLADKALFATSNWSIKEALFKAWRQKEVRYSADFLIKKLFKNHTPFSTTALAEKKSIQMPISTNFHVHLDLIFENFTLALVQSIE